MNYRQEIAALKKAIDYALLRPTNLDPEIARQLIAKLDESLRLFEAAEKVVLDVDKQLENARVAAVADRIVAQYTEPPAMVREMQRRTEENYRRAIIASPSREESKSE